MTGEDLSITGTSFLAATAASCFRRAHMVSSGSTLIRFIRTTSTRLRSSSHRLEGIRSLKQINRPSALINLRREYSRRKCIMLSRLVGACAIIMLLVVPVFAAEEAPAWLQAAAAISVPAYERDVPAVVLQREQHVTVNEDGRVTTVTTFAIRILLREGRQFARASEFYESDSGKVKDIKAWLIRASGQIKKYGKDEVLDAVEDPNDVYNESRLKLIDGSKDADTGSVFGYQTTTEER